MKKQKNLTAAVPTTPMKGLDNSSILSSPRSTMPSSKIAPPPKRPRRNHPLAVAVRDAERALNEAKERFEDATERHEKDDVAHVDQTWDNGNAAETAKKRMEAAEAKLAEAKRDYMNKFGRSWDE